MCSITSTANFPSSTNDLLLYSSCNSFKAVIPKENVELSSNGAILSFKSSVPP